MHNVYSNYYRAGISAPVFLPAVGRKLFLLFLFLPVMQLVRAQAPHITAFHPVSAGYGDTVTITGVHFDSVSAVHFGGVAAQSFFVLSDSLIRAIVGTGASGAVRVATPVSGDSLSGFTFIPPAPPTPPHLTSFTPHSAGHGDTVLLLGTHLTGVTAVTFGGVSAQSFSIVSDSALWAIVGPGATGKVKVFTATSSDSLSGFSFILSTSPVPHILSFSPDSARKGDTVIIKGYDFTGAGAVSFGGVAAHAFSVQGDTLIRAIVDSGASGRVKVVHLTSSDSLAGFIFIPTPPVTLPPTVSSFSPSSGGMGTVVTIHGTHFTGTTQILFGGTPAASFTVLSDTLLSTVIGSGSTGAVKVFTHGGLAVAAATFGFIPTPPTAPHILFFRPDSARQGDTVTIYGPHLDSVIAVSFGGVPAQSFVIAADSLIKAIVGTGASGYVTVASADASDSLGGFIFIPADTTIPPPPPSAFTLISFSGMAASHHAVLNWDVLHDQSVFFYSVEHSVDTISAHFGGIGGDVALHLDSAHYTFTDTALRSGVQYYRLRIIDTVGATTLSYPIAVSLGDSVGSLSLYPNPASWQITVQVPSRLSSSRFVLADASGHIVLTVPVRAGVQQVTLPVGRFNRGVYKLVWSNGRATATQTVLLMK